MENEPTYTVFIRLPFPRGTFVDPPQVNWSLSKDEALWGILSAVSKNDIDWNELATRFQVTVDFLLQQVTFLTERHASQVRAQMRKAAAAAKGGSSAASPIPGSDSQGLTGGEPMRRAGSAGGGGTPRAPSSLSVGRDPLKSEGMGSGSGTGTPTRATGLASRPGISRNPSTSTPGHTAILPKGPVLKGTAERRRLSSLPISTTTASEQQEETEQQVPRQRPEDDPASPGPAEDEETSSDTASSKSSPAQSRLIRRPPRFSGGQQTHTQDGAVSLVDEESEEAEPAFLPFKSPTAASATSGAGSAGQDMGATLRLPKGKGKEKAVHQQQGLKQSQTSDSSNSSAAPPLTRERTAVDRRPHGPLSPRRTAELAGRSPGGKGKGYSREGSDGTPSMGSSFSDLDDASVTQSALEEALASKLQDGGTIGSRMSTISQAIRSRYMPKAPPRRSEGP